MASASTSSGMPTVEEVIALLKKTSLKTIIVEGACDVIVYRKLEDEFAHLGISVLPVGGREKILDIFSRRGEVPQAVKLAFFADQDVWINTGIPPAYQAPNIIFTNGYSIENDVFIDGTLIKLLEGVEVGKFEAELRRFVDWYALALARHLVNNSKPISLHPKEVLSAARYAALTTLGAGETYPTALRDQVLHDYQRMLRGKSLFALLIEHTNSRGGGKPRHTAEALIEAVSLKPGPLINRFRNSISQLFAPP